MSELSHRSARILMDLQACQTGASRTRGVGRFSQALFANVLMQRGEHEIHALVSAQLPAPVEAGASPGTRVHRAPALPAWGSGRDFPGGEQDSLDALALSAFVAPLNADVIHVSHAFEGLDERLALPSVS